LSQALFASKPESSQQDVNLYNQLSKEYEYFLYPERKSELEKEAKEKEKHIKDLRNISFKGFSVRKTGEAPQFSGTRSMKDLIKRQNLQEIK